jgi:hypothetical protein
LPNVITVVKSRGKSWAEYVTRMGGRGMHIGFWWESQKERDQLGRHRCRWEGNIKIDLREIGWRGMVQIYLAKYRDLWRALVNTVINIRVPSNVGKFSSRRATGLFSRRIQLHGVS